MKRLLYGVLAAGASILVTGGVLTPTAQAEPDIHVSCKHTVYIEDDGVVAVNCTGAPVGTRDRGLLTLEDARLRFYCRDIHVGVVSSRLTVRANDCYRVSLA